MATTVHVKDSSLNYEYAYRMIIQELNSGHSNIDTSLKDTSFLYINLCTHKDVIKLLEDFYNGNDINEKVTETGISRSDYVDVSSKLNFNSIKLFEFINILDYANQDYLKEVVHADGDQYVMIKLIKHNLLKEFIKDNKSRIKLIEYLRHIFINEVELCNHTKVEVQCGNYNILLEVLYGFEFNKSKQVYINIKEITHL